MNKTTVILNGIDISKVYEQLSQVKEYIKLLERIILIYINNYNKTTGEVSQYWKGMYNSTEAILNDLRAILEERE